ncbi:hypothetical protein FCU45_04945 [Sulfurimonas crateris]|uniref:Porin n=1 Tax=Sulfurimonas crateris TaxID=2574727 RepID=A0A4U2Z8T8_9BACT|nr:hypothetical protein [Sulfurimonas crateris]TKI69962.1 hypothetical protein FCU45_04945 [Sulfurimonas crateris]
MMISKTTAPFLALLLAASAYGVENVKVSGGAKYWYQTTVKDTTSNDFFQQESSVGVAAVELGVSADLYEGLKGKASVIGVDSLGLEQSFVKDISSAGAGRESGDNYYRTQIWISEANLDYKIANTSVIVGRQALNTPLLFTERWNATYNTFDAAVLINSDLPYTTLVAGYVYQHNGGASAGNATATNFPSTTMHNGSYYGFGSSYDGTTVTDAKRGAYAFGAMIKPPVENLAVNLWYYNINSTFTAYWADAEYKNSGLFVGIQNAGINLAASGIDDAMITAAKIGYSVDKFSADISCSTTATGEDGTATIANAATGDKSKVYTQSVFQDGAFVGTRDTDAIRAAASYQFDGLKLTASLQNAEQTSKEGMEFDLIASAKLGKYVSLTGIYVHQDVDEKTAADFKNDAIRLIAAVKF